MPRNYGAPVRFLALPIGALVLASCAPVPPPEPAITDGCPVLASRGWTAHLDAMPGPGKTGPTLVIQGEVDVPTPGYRLALIPGPADRMMPPSRRFRLDAAAPGGMTAQVVTTAPISYRGPAGSSALPAIIVLCGDRTLATISDLPTAH